MRKQNFENGKKRERAFTNIMSKRKMELQTEKKQIFRSMVWFGLQMYV